MPRLARKSEFDSPLACSRKEGLRDPSVLTRSVCFCWLEAPTACRWSLLETLLQPFLAPVGVRTSGVAARPCGVVRGLCGWRWCSRDPRATPRLGTASVTCWPSWSPISRFRGGWLTPAAARWGAADSGGDCVLDARRMGAEACTPGLEGDGRSCIRCSLLRSGSWFEAISCAVGVSLGDLRVLLCSRLHSCHRSIKLEVEIQSQGSGLMCMAVVPWLEPWSDVAPFFESFFSFSICTQCLHKSPHRLLLRWLPSRCLPVQLLLSLLQRLRLGRSKPVLAGADPVLRPS